MVDSELSPDSFEWPTDVNNISEIEICFAAARNAAISALKRDEIDQHRLNFGRMVVLGNMLPTDHPMNPQFLPLDNRGNL